MKAGIYRKLYRNQVAAEKAQKAAAAKTAAEPAPVRKESTSKARNDSTSGNRGKDRRDDKGGPRNREGKNRRQEVFFCKPCDSVVLAPASSRVQPTNVPLLVRIFVLNGSIYLEELSSWTLVSRGETLL